MVSVLCPTRGRPASVERLLESAQRTADAELECVLYLDEDDSYYQATREVAWDRGARIVSGPRILLSEAWNRCYEAASHDVVMQCGDDIVFRTQGWDVTVEDMFRHYPDRIVFVHGDDGFQHERIGTHGFLHRRWVEAVGYFVPPYFASDYNDLWLSEVADALGRRVYLEDVLTEHMHPVVGKAPLDQTHRERLARHEAEDCDRIWRDTAGLRAQDVQKLQRVIHAHAEKMFQQEREGQWLAR